MKYLDSNIVIAAALAGGEPVRRRLTDAEKGDVVTSAVAFAEVVPASVRGKPPVIAALAAFVEEVAVLPFDDRAARAYATLPFERFSYDRLIAAHALSLGLTLVTDNDRDRDRGDVPGLRVEHWLRE